MIKIIRYSENKNCIKNCKPKKIIENKLPPENDNSESTEREKRLCRKRKIKLNDILYHYIIINII